MSVNLKKGQKINLSKEKEGLSRVIVGLGWDAAERTGGFFSRKPASIDCDASAFVLQNGHLNGRDDIVYFAHLDHPSDAIHHMGDNLTGDGDGDDEQIVVDLKKLPDAYDRVVVVCNIYHAHAKRQNFGMICNAFIRICDAATGQELCRFNLTDDYSSATAVIFGELYRHNGEWKFNAVGQGTSDGSISEVARRYQ